MGETLKTLVYCVGGLADRANEFQKLYDHLDYESYARQTAEINGDKTVKRIHSFRQSTIIPYPWRIKPIEKVEPRPGQPEPHKSAIPLFTDQTAEDIAQQLDHDIETVSREINAKEIIIIAYSSGSALVRRALLLAKERELEREKLTEIHLLESKKPTNNRFQRFQVEPWQLYWASKFITDTRIGLNRHPRSETHETFHILGSQDQFLSPRDAVEPGMKDKNPTYLEVTGFDHNTILGMDQDKEKGS